MRLHGRLVGIAIGVMLLVHALPWTAQVGLQYLAGFASTRGQQKVLEFLHSGDPYNKLLAPLALVTTNLILFALLIVIVRLFFYRTPRFILKSLYEGR